MNIKEVLIAALCMTSSGSMMAQTPAKKLLSRIEKIQKKGIMVGHQDDPVYGTTWKWDLSRSDVKDVTGDYPAVMGFDLGKLELDSPVNLDSVPFDRMRQEIIDQYKRGGIVTLSWHPWNPATGGNAWDASGEAVKTVFRGGENHRKFEGWLRKVADFIKSLKTPEGESVPVIFRPWHEMNGGWFWWGANSCTPEEFVNLYTFTYKKLHGAGCDNIVWAWSPNLGEAHNVEAFLERYPGDQYVDMMGVDIYEFDGNDTGYQDNLKKTLDILTAAAKQEGKTAALTETGCRGVGQKATWFTQTLWPVLRQYDLSYILFWRNDYSRPDMEAYLPAPGDASAPDFKAFYKLKRTLFIKDIKNIK